jgi:hypothetical protein
VLALQFKVGADSTEPVALRRWFAAPYLISPASLGSVRLISGMQMINSSPANSANMYGT